MRSERLHSVFAFRFIQVPSGKPERQISAYKLGGEFAEDAPRGPPPALAVARGRGWADTLGQILLVPHLPELSSVEGALTGHTPGEISSVWGSTTAADVVGGGGGDRDTLGGCAGPWHLTVTVRGGQPSGFVGVHGGRHGFLVLAGPGRRDRGGSRSRGGPGPWHG